LISINQKALHISASASSALVLLASVLGTGARYQCEKVGISAYFSRFLLTFQLTCFPYLNALQVICNRTLIS